MEKIVPFLLLLLLISGCTAPMMRFSDFPPWFMAVFSVIILSFLIIAIAYMAGNALSLPEIVAWANNEFFQTCSMALMVGMLLFFYGFLDTVLFPAVTNTAPGGAYNLSSNNIMTAAQNYTVDVGAIISIQFSALLYFQIALGRFEFMMLRLMPGGVGIVIQIGSLFVPLLHLIGYALNMLGMALWSVQLQFAILKFAEQYMLTLFLPLGILLRTFPYTRAVGGAFIAIAIGLFVIYPLTFIVNMTILHDHFVLSQTKASSFTTDVVFFITKFDIFATGDPLNPFEFAWFAIRVLFSGVMAIYAIPWVLLAQLIGGDAFLEDVAFSVVVYALVLPLINVFMTLTFTRAISQMFGADVNVNSITRLL